jgi:Cyclic nucleotide-binding domain
MSLSDCVATQSWTDLKVRTCLGYLTSKYIYKGKVRLSVVSKTGKEATLGILTAGQFFGEGRVAGQSLRMGSATAMPECELLRM